MEGRELVVLKDLIAEHLLEGKKDIDQLYELLEEIVPSKDHLRDIMHGILSDHYRYFEVDEDRTKPVTMYYVAKPSAREFLECGGFTKDYDNSVIAYKKINLDAQKDGLLRDQNIKLTSRQLNSHWIPIVISMGAAIIAALSYFYPLKGGEVEGLAKKVDSFQMEVIRIRTDFERENQDLRERLYKAEILISVYEWEGKSTD